MSEYMTKAGFAYRNEAREGLLDRLEHSWRHPEAKDLEFLNKGIMIVEPIMGGRLVAR